MSKLHNKSVLRYLLRAPVHLFRWRLGPLFGKRFLLLTHTGRRSGKRHQTVLEVMQYREDGPEAVVMIGFGRNSDWLRNIKTTSNEEVVIGSRHFQASHRFLGEDEAANVVRDWKSETGTWPLLFAGFLADSSAGNIGGPTTIAIDSLGNFL